MADAPPVTVNIQRQVIVESPEDDALQPEPTERGSRAFHSPMILFFDSSSKSAFFKLQSSVSLLIPSSQTDHSDTIRSMVHLCITPEHITSLVHDRLKLPERLAPLYKKISGQEAIRLQFILSKSPKWIVPSLESLIPKAQEDAQLLAAFRRLTSAQSVTVYMPSNALSEAQALSLCHAASTSGQLHSSPQHADFQRWYPSSGYNIVPQDGLAHVVLAHRPAESPPSYDSLSPLSQGPQAGFESRKRKRASSEGHERPVHDKDVLRLDRAVRMISRMGALLLEVEKKEAQLRKTLSQTDQLLARLAETRPRSRRHK